MSAGLSAITASDYVMVIDGDLQDPPEMLHDFLRKSKEGFTIEYGVRKNEKNPSLRNWPIGLIIASLAVLQVLMFH